MRFSANLAGALAGAFIAVGWNRTVVKAGSVVLHVLVSVEYIETTPNSGAQERDFPSSLKIHSRHYPGIPMMNQNLKKARSADSWPKSRTASNGAISCAFLESSGATPA